MRMMIAPDSGAAAEDDADTARDWDRGRDKRQLRCGERMTDGLAEGCSSGALIGNAAHHLPIVLEIKIS